MQRLIIKIDSLFHSCSRIAIIGLIPLFLSAPAIAQMPSVSARLDSSAMMIGEQINLHLSVNIPAGKKLHWPPLKDTLTSKILIVSKSKIDTLPGADQRSTTYKQKVLITVFDSGYYVVPPVRFEMEESDNDLILPLQTDPILLQVVSPTVDTTLAIKPIKGPISAPLTFAEVAPYILGSLLLAGIIAFIIYYIRKRRSKKPLFDLKAEIRPAPHEWALRELENLRQMKLWQNGRFKEYHSMLTEILRQYMEARFEIPAMEMVSYEIIQALEGQGVTQQPIEKMRNILFLADLVKFSKAQPLPGENDGSMSAAVDFVNLTTMLVASPESPSIEAITKEPEVDPRT
ncbi:MAG: hypothetical protein FJY10_01310 [Bacteroidetes bacterium]|nr:hypothetical protein [Bacteroidota bacterium]